MSHGSGRAVSAPFYTRKKILFYLAAIVVCAFALRSWRIEENFGGIMSIDERSMSRTYPGLILTYFTEAAVNRQHFYGVTQFFYGIVVLIWSKIFGCSLLAARYLAVTVGIAGVISSFFLVRTFFGVRTGLTAALLLAISVPAVFYSRFAIETGSVLFFLPLALILYMKVDKERVTFLNFFYGFLSGIFCFTYPGYLCGAAAIILSITIIYRREVYAAVSTSCGLRTYFYGSLSALFALLPIHSLITAQVPPFLGGATRHGHLSDLPVKILKLLSECFIDGRTWLVRFPDFPFLEPAITGFAIIGILTLSRRYPNRRVVSLVILVFAISVLLTALSGERVSVRRMVWFIIPFTTLAAVGANELLSASKPIHRLLLLIAFVHGPLYFILKFVPLYATDKVAITLDGFLPITISDDIIRSAIIRNDLVILRRSEISDPFTQLYYRYVPAVFRWTDSETRMPGKIAIMTDQQIFDICRQKGAQRVSVISPHQLDSSLPFLTNYAVRNSKYFLFSCRVKVSA